MSHPSPYGELGAINDWAGKLCGAAVRIAGLLHAADLAPRRSPWDAPISAEVMQRALRIGDYLIHHARAAFSEMSVNPETEDAKFILGWIRRRGTATFSERDLYQALKGGTRFKRVEALQSPLNILIERGFLRRRTAERTGAGRPPAAIYEVNPASLVRVG